MKEWEYHPPPDIDATLLESLRDFPRQPHMVVYALRSLAALLLRGWMKIYHRLEVVGRDNLPQSGSFIIVCNHTSHLDTLSLLTALPLKKFTARFLLRLPTIFSRACHAVRRRPFSSTLCHSIAKSKALRA